MPRVGGRSQTRGSLTAFEIITGPVELCCYALQQQHGAISNIHSGPSDETLHQLGEVEMAEIRSN